MSEAGAMEARRQLVLKWNKKLGGMGIGKEKSWRKEDENKGDQTKTSTKRNSG